MNTSLAVTDRFHSSTSQHTWQQLDELALAAPRRTALEAAVLLRVTTADVLRALVGCHDVDEVMNWLRQLPFICGDQVALWPIPAARAWWLERLRRRRRESLRPLLTRAVEYYFESLYATPLDDPRVLSRLYDLAHLHRLDPTADQDFFWSNDQPLCGRPATGRQWLQVQQLIAQNEGPEALTAAEFWHRRQPESVLLYSDERGCAGGVSIVVRLSRATADDLRRDPATRVVWEYLECVSPLRHGECALLTRTWFARDHYQAISLAQSSMWLDSIRRYVTVPRLNHSFVAFAEPDCWARAMAYFGFARSGVFFRCDDTDFGLYEHDWRKTAAGLWLATLAERLFVDADAQVAADASRALEDTAESTVAPGAGRERASEIRFKTVPTDPDAGAREQVEIGHGGSWFRAGGSDAVDLSRRKPLKRILQRLLQARLEQPGKSLSIAEVQAAGWPGERMLARAGSGRVYVAICTLRKLGLSDVLVRAGKGYLLHPAVAVNAATATTSSSVD